MRTVKELQAALGERYDGPTKEIRGMTYVPWNEAVKQAIAVFGPDGFDIGVQKVERVGDGFMAVVAVTAYTSDGRAVTRTNVGFNEIAVTQSGKELVDTAIKGAVSDAINRALKLFGDAFGLYLYDKDEKPAPAAASRQAASRPAAAASTRQGTAQARPAASSGGKWSDKPAREGLSEKQIWVLENKLGVTEDELDGMTAGEAKEILDAGMGNGSKKAPVKPAASRRPATPDDLDDLLDEE